MNRNYLTGIILAWILSTLIYYFGPVSLLQWLSLTALLAAVVGIFYFQEKQIVEDFLEETQEHGDSAISQLDFDKLEDRLEEFSEKRYSDFDDINIRWDLSDFDSAPLDAKGDEILVVVNGALGQHDRKIQVFVHVPSYSIPTHKRIRAGQHQEKYPFKYCDFYQENKSRSTDLEDIPGGQNQAMQGFYRANMPPSTNIPAFRNEGDQSEGDE